MNEQPEALRLADALDSRREPSATHYINEAADELRRLHAENEQLRSDLESIGAGGVGPLMPGKPSDCIPRKFNTWSPNEGDTWYEHPADARIIEDVFGGDMPVVGDEYEVIGGWCGVKARYRITSVSEDGDCEVECVSHQSAAAAPKPPVVGQSDNDTVPVLRSLLGAACAAINRKQDAPKLLEQLRRYTTGDLSQPAGEWLESEGRQAFEAWCYSAGLMQQSHGIVSISSHTDMAWLAWQAAAAQKPPENQQLRAAAHQAPAAYQLLAHPGFEWTECSKEDFDLMQANPSQYPGIQLRALYPEWQLPRFNTWSSNEGDSWYDHPADAQLIHDTLGDDVAVGDEFELTAGWKCVTARYRITSVSEDGDCEVECISHQQENAVPKPPVNQQLREAAQQALQALQVLCDEYGRQMTAMNHKTPRRAKWTAALFAIATLSQAIEAEQQVSNPVESHQIEPLTDEAKAVIDAARAAMDHSTESYNGRGDISIASELAAALSLRLDEYDRAIEAAHGIE